MAYWCIDGTDGDDGTGASGATPALAAAAPFLTIAGIGVFALGDTVLFKRGTSNICHEAGWKGSMTIEAYYNADGTDDTAQSIPGIDANGTGYAFQFAVKNNIVIRNLRFFNGGDVIGNTLLYVERCDGFTVTGCEFEGDNAKAHRGIMLITGKRVNTSNFALKNVIVQNNIFTNFLKTDVSGEEAIRIVTYANIIFTGDGSNGQPSNWLIDDNEFTDCGLGIRQVIYDTAETVDEGLLHTDIRITNNTLSDCRRGIAQIGWMDVGYNCINNNRLVNIGGPLVDKHNVIQTQMCKGGEIIGNYVNGAETNDAGDGNAIIIDWGYPDALAPYHSDGVLVERNITINCNHSNNGGGIAVWKGRNCIVQGNRTENCNVGIKVSTDACTGTIVRRNTMMNSLISGYASRISAPEVEFYENIIDTAPVGIALNGATVVEPDEHDNCVYNVTSNDLTLDASDITTDPKLNTDGTLQSDSPCVGIGTKWWGTDRRPVGFNGEPFPDWDIDIGANQSIFSPHHPSNI